LRGAPWLFQAPLDDRGRWQVNEFVSIVIDARIIGQQARPIVRKLRQAGLVPRVEWSYVGQVPAGTIISIKPEGDLVPGTVVTVTVAAPESD
jgi:hypothetical protein